MEKGMIKLLTTAEVADHVKQISDSLCLDLRSFDLS